MEKGEKYENYRKNFVRELKRKNEKSLEYLIDNYAWIIKTVASKHLSNFPNFLDECMNDVLMDIWNNIHRFDESKGDIKNWIAGITKFKAIDYKRKYAKEIYNQDIDTLNIKSFNNMEESILKLEISDEMDSLLSCLAEKDRQLFLKLYVEDRTIEDISSETGLKRDNIYNRISRGKKKIRNLFELKV